jgi:hypothetical protein
LTVSVADAAQTRSGQGIWRWIFAKHDIGLNSFGGWLKPATAFALLLLLFAGAWWVWRNREREAPLVQTQPTPGQITPMPSPANNSVDRPPTSTHDANARGPLVTENKQPPRRPNELVARSFIPATAGVEGDNATRSENRNAREKTLREIRRVYLQPSDDNEVTRKVLVELQKRISGVLSSVDADNADAAVKISAQTDRSDQTRVVVIIKMVNANGQVVWPNARHSGSWKYVGRPGLVAERIMSDLNRAVSAARPEE